MDREEEIEYQHACRQKRATSRSRASSKDQSNCKGEAQAGEQRVGLSVSEERVGYSRPFRQKDQGVHVSRTLLVCLDD